jgi:glutamate racemase
MHILITDSGVGGLSVCAYAERFLRVNGIEIPTQLTYVNASPENDFGYNSMASRKEKLKNFDRFLHIVADRYSPDLIYVACNTLSVLLADTKFSKNGRLPVRGIVETGVNRLLRDLRQFPQSIVAIFGTVTTIEEQTYPDLLKQNGIHESRIIAQPCPSLADTISEDRQGLDAQKKINKYVRESIERSSLPPTHHLTYLACTHYGYRKEFFSTAFDEHGIHTKILNPNEFVIDDLFGSSERNLTDLRQKGGIDVEFVTRYKIPETALKTISFFLEEVSPKTIQAFTNYTYSPELF